MKIIQCSDNYTCEISAEKINQQNIYDIILALDAFITTNNIILENTQYTNSEKNPYIIIKDIYEKELIIEKSKSYRDIGKIWFSFPIDTHKIGSIDNGKFISYQPHGKEASFILENNLHLNTEDASKLRIAILNEMAPHLNSHDIADLVDKNTMQANDIIIDIWGYLKENTQKLIFMYACEKGNLDLAQKLYNHTEHKFIENLGTTLEEFGMQVSMQPSAKKVLKFFKETMVEKSIDFSQSMENWVRENKLGRKIKV